MNRRRLLAHGTLATGLLTGCLRNTGESSEPTTDGANDTAPASKPDSGGNETATDDDTNASPRDNWCETTDPPTTTSGQWTHAGFDAAHTSASSAASIATDAPCFRWEHQENGQTAPVTATADLVIFPGTRDGSSVTAFDRETGERQWSADDGIVDDVSHSHEPAVIDGDNVFFEARESSRTNQGYVFAVDLTTGEERWRFGDLEEADADNREDSERFIPGVTAVDGRVFVQSTHATYALDAATGDRLWRAGEGGSTPTVGNGLMFGRSRTKERGAETAGEGVLYALDVESGEEQWSVEQGADTRQPTYADGLLFVPLFNGEETMTAIDAASGETHWVHESRASAVSQAVADGTVYCATSENGLIAFDAETGDHNWVFNPEYTLGQSAPVVTDDLVLHAGNDTGANKHGVFAVDRDSGDQQWLRQFADPVFRSPTVADDELWVVTQTGSLLAFR